MVGLSGSVSSRSDFAFHSRFLNKCVSGDLLTKKIKIEKLPQGGLLFCWVYYCVAAMGVITPDGLGSPRSSPLGGSVSSRCDFAFHSMFLNKDLAWDLLAPKKNGRRGVYYSVGFIHLCWAYPRGSPRTEPKQTQICKIVMQCQETQYSLPFFLFLLRWHCAC